MHFTRSTFRKCLKYDSKPNLNDQLIKNLVKKNKSKYTVLKNDVLKHPGESN